ncbi:MAG: hypothetical protein Q4P15_12410 [Propionibacteriaceae bacterium]|nr:hypothetical protein [Propionibacteriaceae bacterium]
MIIAAVASVAAIAAAVFAWFALSRAGRARGSADAASALAEDALARAKEATALSAEQQVVAEANNSAVRDAVSLATEALRLTRDEQERVQRREDELHEINWGVTWDDILPLNEPAHVIDRRLRVVQYGPDDAQHVQIFFYVGSFRWLARDVGDMKIDASLTLFPAERKRMVREQLNRRWKDTAGNAVTMRPDSPSVVAAVDGLAYKAFHSPTKIIIRWKSPAGISHQQIFQFRPLSEAQLGADVKHPLP